MAHRLSCSAACWDLPGPRTEHVSPTLADGFFTTEPPEKPEAPFFLKCEHFTIMYGFQ